VGLPLPCVIHVGSPVCDFEKEKGKKERKKQKKKEKRNRENKDRKYKEL